MLNNGANPADGTALMAQLRATSFQGVSGQFSFIRTCFVCRVRKLGSRLTRSLLFTASSNDNQALPNFDLSHMSNVPLQYTTFGSYNPTSQMLTVSSTAPIIPPRT